MVSCAYENFRQFDYVSYLQNCIVYEWENFSIKDLRPLIESLTNCSFGVIERRGVVTRY